jgi:hypothetical protein
VAKAVREQTAATPVLLFAFSNDQIIPTARTPIMLVMAEGGWCFKRFGRRAIKVTF